MKGDLYKHKGQRKKLVEIIRNKGIHDENVLNAIEKIPRHLFLDSSFAEFAYQDKPFPIGAGQTISQPFTVAFQTQLLNLKKGDIVLEIGTGSGYQSCVLAEIGVKVYTVERQKSLYLKNSALIKELGYGSIKTFFGDGYKGLTAFAPFDKILVTAGAPFIPEALKDQLVLNGILVIPVGKGNLQIMTSVSKIPISDRNADLITNKSTPYTYKIEEHGTFSFVPLVADKENNNKSGFNI